MPDLPDLPDDKPADAAIDPDRIDPHTGASVSEWAGRLGVTESELLDAMTEVGDRASDVEAHLRRTRGAPSPDAQADGTRRP